jgi:DME family drug/metabolite transporter
VVNLLIQRHGFRPETISFWRFVVGSVVLLAVFGRPSLWHALRGQALAVLGAGTCMALYVLAWFLGIERIGASIPTLIALCLPPVLVTAWAVLRGRETLDAPLAAAGGGGGRCAGRAARRRPGRRASAGTVVAGVLFSVASAVLYTGFTLVSGRCRRPGRGAGDDGSHRGGRGGHGPERAVRAAGLAGDARRKLAALPRAGHGGDRLAGFQLGAARLGDAHGRHAGRAMTAVLLAAVLLGQALSASQWVGRR